MRAVPSLDDFWSLRYAAGGSPVTQALSQRIGAVCAWLLGLAGLSPSQVTLLGASSFVLAALLYAVLPGGLASMLLLAALLQFGYGLDCADGQLARATQQTSALGAWLDVACDYLRNVVLALGVAAYLLGTGMPVGLAFIPSGVMLAGTAIKLHTHTVLLDAPGAEAGSTGDGGRFRSGVRLALDTATHLLALALLRDWPLALAAYAALCGAAYTGLAFLQAKRRLGD